MGDALSHPAEDPLYADFAEALAGCHRDFPTAFSPVVAELARANRDWAGAWAARLEALASHSDEAAIGARAAARSQIVPQVGGRTGGGRRSLRMKIRAIQVGQFGVWQQLSLAVPERGVALFYGPNEAGKSTLLRFIRSMLYGFEPFAVELSDGSSRPVGWEGVLRVESQGHEYEIRRVWDRGTRGLVSVVGTDREQPAESLLAELLFRTDESLYENVFAVGLNELQELATLQGDEVARHIYGLTLGPTGRKLLEATATVDQARRSLLDPASRSGRLADLLEREQSLREEIAAQHSLREEHAEQCRERNRIQNRIESLQKKQGDVERQHGGAPTAGSRLAALDRSPRHPTGTRFDSRSLRLPGRRARTPRRSWTLMSTRPARSRRTLVESVKALRGKLHCFAGHKELHTHASALVGFVEQAGWYRDVTQQAASARAGPKKSEPSSTARLEALGPDWTRRTARIARHGAGSADGGCSRRPPAIGPPSAAATACCVSASGSTGPSASGEPLLDEQMKTLGDRPLDEAIAEQHRACERLRGTGRPAAQGS